MNIINRIHNYLQSGRSWYQRSVGDITKIVVHHSAARQDGRETDESILNKIMGWHTNKGWAGLSYHFVITPNGNIFQTNDLTDITWHDTVNNDSIGILVHGYFHPPYNEEPTDAQLESLENLLDYLCTECPEFPADRDDVLGHRQRSATACPGDNLYPFVKSYRENNMENKELEICQTNLEAMETNKNEWKKKARDREEEIEKLGKDILEKQEHIESLQKSLSEMNLQLTNITQQYKQLQETEKSLRIDCETSKEQIKTLGETIEEDKRLYELLSESYGTDTTKLQKKLDKCKIKLEEGLSGYSKWELFKAFFGKS